MRKRKKTIIITGASSGIGHQLAIEYAKDTIKVFLFGRDEARLKNTKDMCNNLGASAEYIICDVRDKISMQKNIDHIIKTHGLDLLIASAGVSAGTLGGPEKTEQIEDIFATNFTGVLNSVLPCLDFMIKQQYGSIAIIGSMAGLLPLASAPSYSASKAAVNIWTEALSSSVKKYNVKVSLILPWYVKTPMTAKNNFPMPFILSSDKAAKIIKNALDLEKLFIIFPLPIYFLVKMLNFIPKKIWHYINSKLPAK